MKRLLFVAAIAAMVFSTGCKPKWIDHVAFKPSDDFKTARVSLVFKDNIQTNMAGVFQIKDYGYIFVNPYTPAQRFEVGFDLNLDIVTDQDYVSITPTEYLPNGVPLGVGYPLVELRSPEPISTSFDAFGYVDVSHAKWLGVATMFKFLNDEYFPQGLTISQVFEVDAANRPAVIASVFGPTLNADGTLKRAGGIALLANVRQLIEQNRVSPGRESKFFPKGKLHFSGPAAAKYEGRIDKLLKIEKKLMKGFNSQN
ncbi:MAG TPA: hypothetical protein VJB59_05645 [Bdellovibrionota bacterium]|nr:hypothetical protein [Bdellovibrionota bacterium]